MNKIIKVGDWATPDHGAHLVECECLSVSIGDGSFGAYVSGMVYRLATADVFEAAIESADVSCKQGNFPNKETAKLWVEEQLGVESDKTAELQTAITLKCQACRVNTCFVNPACKNTNCHLYQFSPWNKNNN